MASFELERSQVVVLEPCLATPEAGLLSRLRKRSPFESKDSLVLNKNDGRAKTAHKVLLMEPGAPENGALATFCSPTERVQLSRRILPANAQWNTVPWLAKEKVRDAGAAGSQGRRERRQLQ